MSKDRQTILYLDGRNVEPSVKLLESLRPGVLKAKGVFETMRSKGLQVYALNQHLDRLNQGLKKLNIPLSIKKPEILRFIKSLLKVSSLKSAKIRLSVWSKNKIIHSAVLIQPLNQLKSKFKVMISSVVRRPSEFSRFKTLDYKIYQQAFEQAKKKNFDEVILLNSKGFVVEGSRTNIFVVKDGELITPPLSAGCLDGTVRKLVLAAANQLKISCKQKNLTIKDLKEADQVFVTNAVIGLVPVVQIEDFKIEKKLKENLMKKLLQKYNSLLLKTLK